MKQVLYNSLIKSIFDKNIKYLIVNYPEDIELKLSDSSIEYISCNNFVKKLKNFIFTSNIDGSIFENQTQLIIHFKIHYSNYNIKTDLSKSDYIETLLSACLTIKESNVNL